MCVCDNVGWTKLSVTMLRMGDNVVRDKEDEEDEEEEEEEEDEDEEEQDAAEQGRRRTCAEQNLTQ